MTDCIFCKIVNKQIPVEPVFETDNIIAFYDINPQAPTHILVIPKKHVEDLNRLEDEKLMGKLLQGVKDVTKKLDIKEYRTVLNTGKQAGQEVFHIHFHIMAGRKFTWPAG